MPDKSLAGRSEPAHDKFDGKSMPESMKEVAAFMMFAQQNEYRFVSSSDKIAEKLTDEHIDTILANSAKEDERHFAAFKFSHGMRILIVVIALIFAFTLLFFFKDSPYFVTIMTAMFSFLGGLGLGQVVKSKD